MSKFIESFKQDILNHVWKSFLENRKSSVQEPIGMWQWAGDCAPIVDGIDAVTIEKGVLSFKVLVNGKVILFSVWVQIGEIRVGYRIPVELLQKLTAETRLSSVYDGRPCARIVKDRNATLFDMLFQIGFADFDYMSTACAEHKKLQNEKTLIIADRLAGIFLHTFIAVLNETISLNNFSVKPGFVGETKSFSVELSGNLKEFAAWAKSNQVLTTSFETIQVSGTAIHMLHCDVPTSVDITKQVSDEWRVVRANSLTPQQS